MEEWRYRSMHNLGTVGMRFKEKQGVGRVVAVPTTKANVGVEV